MGWTYIEAGIFYTVPCYVCTEHSRVHMLVLGTYSEYIYIGYSAVSATRQLTSNHDIYFELTVRVEKVNNLLLYFDRVYL
jgi:hypothetical protein